VDVNDVLSGLAGERSMDTRGLLWVTVPICVSVRHGDGAIPLN
jgi:hypothetical protein